MTRKMIKPEIFKLLAKHPNMKSPEIARRLGCHPSYVRACLHRAGIFRGKHDPSVVYDQPMGKFVRLPVEEYQRLLAAAGEA